MKTLFRGLTFAVFLALGTPVFAHPLTKWSHPPV